MDFGDLGNIINTVKGLNLSDEQKDAIKKAIKTCGDNKEKIMEELKKLNINLTEEQVETALKLADKL